MGSVILTQSTQPLPADFGPTDPLPQGPTVLSTDKLNAAGLSTLGIYCDTTLTTDPDAQISLNPGGSFTAVARQITLQGGIGIPGGSVALTLMDNVSTFAQISASNPAITSQIVLAVGSSIDVSGQRIDNAGLSGSAVNNDFSHIAGGSVSLVDSTQSGIGVAVESGAGILVNGGYGIDQSGKVTGGNAGALSIQGENIALQGSLSGYSLVGNNGGSIQLITQSVEVTSSQTPDPGNGQGLILGADELDATGFTRFDLEAANNVTFDPGAVLFISPVKLATPIPGTAPATDSLIRVTQDLVGTSSIKAVAGVLWQGSNNLGAEVMVSNGSEVKVAPGGSITMSGPGVDVAGTLNAPAGSIALSTTQAGLTVENTGKIFALGYNKPGSASIAAGLPVGYSPMSGGSVTLQTTNAGSGNALTLENGSIVDVSGSAAVTTYIQNAAGVPSSVTVASAPGSITITAGGSLQLKGTLKGQANLSGMQGGKLSIDNSTEDLVISGSDVGNYLSSGFDYLRFQSATGLDFTGAMNYRIGRCLVLDAPVINGSGDQVSLSSPWIQLQNSSSVLAPNPKGGAGTLTLSGDWIDVTGSISISSFGALKLDAQQDIRLSDALYNGLTWSGELNTSGDLTLQANHIYPTTQSNFTVNAGGNVTILRSDTPSNSLIYSAGGSLTINALSIDDEGYLAAPLGQINLVASGRAFLSENAVVTTSGTDRVNYGTVDDIFWTIPDKLNTGSEGTNTINVTKAPDKSVSISGAEVIAEQGSQINVAGGGSIISYQFQAGLQGSNDPFAGGYVIVPGVTSTSSNQAVYLSGMKGLPAGVYSLLPEQYAFLPGAIFVKPVSGTIAAGQQSAGSDGFPVIAGYSTFMGTNISQPLMSAYEIMPAGTAFSRGLFNMGGNPKTFNAGTIGSLQLAGYSGGDAGTVTVQGVTTVLDGSILANASRGYQGGSLFLSGSNVIVEQSTIPLPQGFGFGTPMPDEFAGSLYIAAPSLAGKGFMNIGLGDISSGNSTPTQTVTIQDGITLEASNITLSALNAVTVGSGSQIGALNGGVSIISPNGTVTLSKNSTVNATDFITLDMAQIDFQDGAVIQAPNGSLNLFSGNILFLNQGYSGPQTQNGLYLTSSLWQQFSGFNNVTVTGSSVDFLGGIGKGLSAQNSFTIDSGRIACEPVAGDGNPSVTLSAGTAINLLNTGSGPASPTLGNLASLSLNAPEISAGEGNILLDGFSSVTFTASHDITFKGNGGLATGGDLNFNAGRITTSYYQDASTPYTAVDFSVAAGGVVTIHGTGTPDGTSVPGGILSISGERIDDSGFVDVSSGYLTFAATGTNQGDGIFLRSGSQIFAGGCAYAPGGIVLLRSTSGPITMEQGALIDVSAGSQGDAGAISIISPVGGTVLDGNFKGLANGGLGGSFSLDTAALSDFSTLYAKLMQSTTSGFVGFTGSLSIRTRTGDLTVGSQDDIHAQNVLLVADSGNVNVLGAIDASGAGGGGSVQLFAGNNMTLYGGGSIKSQGTGANANGGNVLLGTSQGMLDLQSNFSIDVSGNGTGQGGSVTFRVPRWTDPASNAGGTDLDIKLEVGSASIINASQVTVEAFKTYVSQDGQIPTDGYGQVTINGNNVSGNAATFMTTMVGGVENDLRLQNGLLASLSITGQNGGALRVIPGVEIDSPGDLTLSSDLDLTSWRYGAGQVPGILTLRAAGNLYINGNLTDAPTPYYNLTGLHGADSWGLNLIAGADLSSANFMAVTPAQGNLNVANGIMVYTENAPVRFASGNNSTIGQGSPNGLMINPGILYNLGSYSGNVQGEVGGNLIIQGGAIQTATGNIDITVGGDLEMESAGLFGYGSGGPTVLGTIRTTGCPTSGLSNYWLYNDGGNITLKVAGAVEGGVQTNSWDYDYVVISGSRSNRTVTNNWGAQYVTGAESGYYATAGLATMAGGNLTVYSGGDFLFSDRNIRLSAR